MWFQVLLATCKHLRPSPRPPPSSLRSTRANTNSFGSQEGCCVSLGRTTPIWCRSSCRQPPSMPSPPSSLLLLVLLATAWLSPLVSSSAANAANDARPAYLCWLIFLLSHALPLSLCRLDMVFWVLGVEWAREVERVQRLGKWDMGSRMKESEPHFLSFFYVYLLFFYLIYILV